MGSKGGGGKKLETYFGSEPFARFDKKNNFSEPENELCDTIKLGSENGLTITGSTDQKNNFI